MCLDAIDKSDRFDDTDERNCFFFFFFTTRVSSNDRPSRRNAKAINRQTGKAYRSFTIVIINEWQKRPSDELLWCYLLLQNGLHGYMPILIKAQLGHRTKTGFVAILGPFIPSRCSYLEIVTGLQLDEDLLFLSGAARVFTETSH